MIIKSKEKSRKIISNLNQPIKTFASNIPHKPKIYIINMQKPQNQNPTPVPTPTQQPTQQQLKRRRRQKILARSNPGSQIVQPEQLESAVITQKSGYASSRTQAFSAYEMFKTSQTYQRSKKYVEWVSVVLGIFVAILHMLSHHGSIAFVIALLLSCTLTGYIQLTRSYKMSKYTTKQGQNPLLQKISNIKQLQIANKVLKIQSAFSPIAKIIASYFLTVVLYSCFFVKKT